MRTDDFRPSDNVEDDREDERVARRDVRRRWAASASARLLLSGWSAGTSASIRACCSTARKFSPADRLREQTSPAPPVSSGTPTDATGKFVALVLGDTEDRWTEIFAAGGQTYHPPKLRLFARSEPTPCAFAQSAMGPFYCPRDQRIYLDTSFFDDLQHKFGGCSNSNACKFSEAYVIAHEVGHHVQNELGILPRVTQMQQASASRAEANRLQVRIELQADCLAGVWANRPSKSTASSIRATSTRRCRPLLRSATIALEKQAQGYVVPDSFTHGTSEQRKRWFSNGFTQGKVSACDTLSANAL